LVVKWSSRSTAELLMALDTLTDSTLQTLIRNEEISSGKRSKIYFNTKHALSIIRVLLKRFNANKISNLTRIYIRESGITRRNWRKYKREKEAERNARISEWW